jgi:regulatory protein
MRRRSELIHERLQGAQGLPPQPQPQSQPQPLPLPLSPLPHASVSRFAAGHAAANLPEVRDDPDSPDYPNGPQSAPLSPRTLKTRAVYYLSKREHSRAELAKKLAQPTYKARQQAFVHKTDLPEAPSAELIEAVLDDLQQQGFLNDQRFAHSLVNRNATKHGAARVLASLGQHKLDSSTTSELAAQLKGSELSRCFAVWARKFEPINRDELDYQQAQAALGKQGRFLMQRGFSSDAVKKVLSGWQPEAE